MDQFMFFVNEISGQIVGLIFATFCIGMFTRCAMEALLTIPDLEGSVYMTVNNAAYFIYDRKESVVNNIKPKSVLSLLKTFVLNRKTDFLVMANMFVLVSGAIASLGLALFQDMVPFDSQATISFYTLVFVMLRYFILAHYFEKGDELASHTI